MRKFILFIFIIMVIPFQNIAMASSDIEVIEQGQIGVDFELSKMKLDFDMDFKLSDSSGIDNIRVTANGEYDETYKFNIDIPNKGELDLTLKEVEPGKYFQLRKHTLYDIYIPSGTLEDSDGNKINKGLHYTFLTQKGEAPTPIKYTSAPNGNDDITSLNSTNLSEDGKIYIKFSSNISIDKEDKITDILDNASLYKVPGAVTALDSKGEIYDKEFIYEYDSSDKKYKANIGTQEILIDSIEVHTQYKDTLVITPTYKLTSLNQYRIIVDKDYIEDEKGYNIEEDLDILFWTKKGTSTATPVWSIGEILGQDIEKDEDSLYPSYTLSGGTSFDLDEPIVLNISSEVVFKADSQQVNSTKSKVVQSALENITLVEGYRASTKINIGKYKLQYYFEDGIKKTKIFIYPPTNGIDNGKLYKLNIPEGVFETRSGKNLSRLQLDFTTIQDISKDIGIYYLENNFIKITDLIKKDRSFSIKGYNFHENVSKIILEPYSEDGSNITINSEDIVFETINNLRVMLSEENSDKLISSKNTGSYKVILYYFKKNEDEVKMEEISSDSALYEGEDKNERIYLWINPKGKPIDINRYPDSKNSDIWYNEKNLTHDIRDSFTSGTSFIKVIFEDVDGTLKLNPDKIKESMIQAEGSGVNMVDIDFINNIPSENEDTYIDKYILIKDKENLKATLYIPVRPLRPQTTYLVTIPTGMIYFEDGTIADNSNSTLSWSFTTTTAPFVGDTTVAVVTGYDHN